MEFSGKSIVVTGGSLGMGQACSLRFAEGGGKVLVVSNDARSVAETVATIGPNASGFIGDVRSAQDMEQAVAEAVARHGGVDILACCAGIQRYGTVIDTPENVWDDVFAVNLKGIYLASRFAIPEMKKRGGGAIVAFRPFKPTPRRREWLPTPPARARSTRWSGRWLSTMPPTI